MSNPTYQQVKLTKAVEGGGHMEDVAYIPSRLAVDGQVIKIKKDGEWDDGWTVTNVSPEKISEEKANALHTHWSAFRGYEHAGRSSYKEKA